MRSLILVGVSVLVLAGHAEAESAQTAAPDEARGKIEAGVKDCQDRRAAGQFATHREAAQCINQAVQRNLSATNYPFPDLVQLVSAYRIACAQKMDGRELTEKDCTARMTELRQRIVAEETRRNGTAGADVKPAAGKSAADAADYGALLTGLAEWSKAGDAKSAPGKIVCLKSGPTLACR
ncbi:MAG: hypothetical protein WCF16_03020 [Alphaproteobacteria bacterium]